MDPTVFPDDLNGLSNEALSGLEAAAIAEFNTLDGENLSDEAMARLAALDEGTTRIRAELAARVAAAADLAERRGRMAAASKPPVDPAEPDADDTVKKAVKAAVKAAMDEAAAEAAALQATEAAAAKAVADATAAAEAAIVAAATSGPSKADTKLQEDNRPQLVITAAADIPHIQSGSRLGLIELADAMHRKAKTLQDHSGYIPIATMEKTFESGYDLNGLSEIDQFEAIMDGCGVNAMTASGGWCAPSEIIYDFFQVECAQGAVLQLPTFRANRGGVRWPVSPPLPAVNTTDWVWTETMDIAASGTKPCIHVPCPTFSECRLDAHGICVTAGNLMSRAYPENLRRYINQVFIAHERNENLRQLAVLESLSIHVVEGGTFGAASAILGALILQATDYRWKFRMCKSATLEAVAPLWVLDVIRADLARQARTLNTSDGLAVISDAEIDAWFKAANINVQWLNDYQSFSAVAQGPGATLTWPTTVNFLLYAPGTFVRFDNGILDLGVIRDSVLNATNDYTAAWTEEFYCIGLKGYESRLVTVPICPSGVTAGFEVQTCPTD